MIHVVVAYLSPLVLVFAPEAEVAVLGDGLRLEWRPWDIGVGRMVREATGYRRSVLRDLLLELEQRDGSGEDGYAVRLPKGKSKGDLDHIEAVPTTSQDGRPVKARWYQPRWWIYLLWAGLPTIATAALGMYVTILTQGRFLPFWQTLMISGGTGLMLLSLKRFADKRAKDSEDA